MTPETVVDIFRDAIFLVVLMVSALILPSLAVGLVVSMFQAATQINEQTLSFLPRLLMTMFVLMFGGPWLLTKILEFTNQLILDIPLYIG